MWRRWFSFWSTPLFCLLLLPAVVVAKDAFNLSEPAPGVFVHLGQPLALDVPGHDDIANIGFIVGTRCVAVIDSGGSIGIGRALRAAIKRTTNVPICYVINTHVHVDHVLGNAAFKSDKPSFVGHFLLPAAIDNSRNFFVQQYGADLDQPPSADQIIGPGRLVKETLDLDLGGRHLTLRAWQKSHTDSDLTVYDEKTGTLWTGDLLFRERLPVLDGSIEGWLAAIDELEKMKVQRVVPGHGAIGSDLTSALSPERHYLQTLLDDVRTEIAQGKSMQDAITHVAAAEKSAWLLWDSTHPHNVTRAYQELEWE